MSERAKMMPLFLLLVVAAVCPVSCTSEIESEFATSAKAITKQLDNLNRIVAAMGNQQMMQQFMLEERTRASGKSGVKVVRLRGKGTKTYHSDSHTSFGSLSIHDHSNNIRTVGLGEFSAVLNGIDFKTRHNDYRLYMPHRTNSSYGTIEEIPFPEVPPSVQNQPDLSKATDEMREYFRAWRDGNKTHRDYTKYFQPLLCYIEGAWTNTGEEIEEPFFSDRHFLDAKSWVELQEKARFVAYSGSKSKSENLAVLPTAITRMINGTIPQFSQFNYRILCHPLKREVRLDRFRMVDDLHRRINKKRNAHQHEHSRAARFTLSATDAKYEDTKFHRGFLDELMEEIPGKDNYPGNLTDDGLELKALNWDGETEKDVSRYHRVYKIGATDATGVSVVNRGFNDDYMFAAMTTQPKVSPMSVKKSRKKINGKWQRPIMTQRWTWAFPIEIVYLTPLQRWNPYNLHYKGDAKSQSGASIYAGGRSGGCTPGKEFDGINSKNYYMTPNEFFGGSHSSSSADTVRGSVCVLDRSGKSRKVQAAGIRSFLPKIGDLGSIRIRYPIFPIHEEGSTTWKELDALKDLVMDNSTYGKYIWQVSTEDEADDSNFQISDSTKSGVTPHRHNVVLSRSEMTSLKAGAELKVLTDTAAGHQHELSLRYSPVKQLVVGRKCDGRSRCWDGHKINPLIRASVSDL